MKKLPKELTNELLGLVLDEEIHEAIMFTNAWGATDNHLTYCVSRMEPDNLIEHHINLDTLTRLIRKKILFKKRKTLYAIIWKRKTDEEKKFFRFSSLSGSRNAVRSKSQKINRMGKITK